MTFERKKIDYISRFASSYEVGEALTELSRRTGLLYSTLYINSASVDPRRIREIEYLNMELANSTERKKRTYF
jgi:hypothetical protein